MDAAQVLTSLQSMYPGQMVLYVGDMARALGKSDKAVSHLISRNSLPFPVKRVGRQRCVDIFSFAEWVASSDEVAEEMTGTSATEGASPVQLTTKKPSKKTTGLTPRDQPTSGTAPPDLGLLGQRIKAMRHDYLPRMARMLTRVTDDDARLFFREVMELLYTDADASEAKYLVRVRAIGPTQDETLSEESTYSFALLEQACRCFRHQAHTLWHIENLTLVHIDLEHSGQLLVSSSMKPGVFNELRDEGGLVTLAGS